MKLIISLLFSFLFFVGVNAQTIKIGSLQYGSVNWELKLIKELELDKKNGFDLEIIELASKNAAAVALQGGAVDLIVTDWFWVSRQRNEGRLFSFVPHSMAAGGLIASTNSKISQDIDLKNKKIGIAGGQVDKGWLIFRAFYKKKYGEDLIKLSEPIFGAPPLLNKKLKQNSFDAILTYWPYQAKLLTDDNFKKVIDIRDILSELGIPRGMPVIGWVFKEKWVDESEEIFKNFLKASDEAKRLMLESDDIWEKVRPYMNASDDKLFKNLRDIYREGIPTGKFTDNQLEGSKKLYSILSKIGGKELVGKATELSPGTFWRN
jgi:NitT/TauT family transport system substrate-binding protein